MATRPQPSDTARTDAARTKHRAEPVVVGWRESVALPEWHIGSVKAKVDTGARTSALHVEDLEDLGRGRVRFRVVRHRGDDETHEVTAKVYRRSRVKPSSGKVEDRYVIKTTIRIGPIEREVEVSLVSRKTMLCRMLVGRNALPTGVVVDPHRRYLHGLPRRKVKRKVKRKKKRTKKLMKKTSKKPTPASKKWKVSRLRGTKERT